MAAVTVNNDFGAQENEVCHCFPVCHEVMGLVAMMLFECGVLSQLFHSTLSPLSRGSLVPLHFLPLGLHNLHI